MNIVIKTIGLLTIRQSGQNYTKTIHDSWYKVMKGRELLYASTKLGEAIAFAEGASMYHFLHQHNIEALNHASFVTGACKEDLLKLFVGRGLNRLKKEHFIIL